jgi:hypothetical protein
MSDPCTNSTRDADNNVTTFGDIIRDPNIFYKWFVKFQSDTGYYINPDNKSLLTNPTSDFTTNINNYNKDISGIITCINSQNISVDELNTSNASIQEQISQNKKDMKKRQEDIQIAKDRALLVRNPELSRSYYDGWFSLGRPMHQLSIPIFIGISTLFLILSLFMILQLLNISSIITILKARMVDRYKNPSNLPFIIVSLIAIIFIGLTIYAFNR